MMLLHDARRDARFRDGELGPARRPGPLAAGTPTQIAAGRVGARPRARRCAGAAPTSLQAAIASLHADEPRDWPQIAALYGELARLTGSPVVELNRAVAVAEADGPEAALRDRRRARARRLPLPALDPRRAAAPARPRARRPRDAYGRALERSLTTRPSGGCWSAGWPSSARPRPVYRAFTASHRGGTGSPLVCLHGFMETWRTWELVLPALERRHDVLALTLPGHAGGPRSMARRPGTQMADAVERAMDEAGFDTAHIAGNSLGGYVALQLAARGRARSVVAFAPAGGWAPGDTAAARGAGPLQARLHEQARATARTRRRSSPRRRAADAATQLVVVELRAHPARPHRPPDARRSRAAPARPR